MKDDLTPRKMAEKVLTAAGFYTQSRPLLDRRHYWYRYNAVHTNAPTVHAVTVFAAEDFKVDIFRMTLEDNTQHLGAYLYARDLLEAVEVMRSALDFYITEVGPIHEPGCSEDDCCQCPKMKLVNDARNKAEAVLDKAKGEPLPSAAQTPIKPPDPTIFDRLKATKTMPELDALRMDCVRTGEASGSVDMARQIQQAFIKAKNRLERIPLSQRGW